MFTHIVFRNLRFETLEFVGIVCPTDFENSELKLKFGTLKPWNFEVSKRWNLETAFSK